MKLLHVSTRETVLIKETTSFTSYCAPSLKSGLIKPVYNREYDCVLFPHPLRFTNPCLPVCSAETLIIYTNKKRRADKSRLYTFESLVRAHGARARSRMCVCVCVFWQLVSWILYVFNFLVTSLKDVIFIPETSSANHRVPIFGCFRICCVLFLRFLDVSKMCCWF